MRVTKRLMAALLACLMLLSLLPVPAYAADDGRIALLAVAQDGYVIEPEYIGYRSGDTVKDVLKNSGTPSPASTAGSSPLWTAGRTTIPCTTTATAMPWTPRPRD